MLNLTLVRTKIAKVAVNLWRSDEAQDLTEYALMLVLLSLAAVAAMNSLATQVGSVFTNASAMGS